MEITANMVKELRQATGAGVLDCRKALDSANGDFDRAVKILREKGLAAAAKKAHREANEGLIGNYVHVGSKVAALVEVNCESDFVARTEEFQTLVKDLAMQIVAARPSWVRIADVPADVLEKERGIYRVQLADAAKPAPIIEKIIDGKMTKFYEESCLLEQPFIKDNGIKVKDLIITTVARLGENIVVRRFARLEVGG
ncbi:MAG: translation elongation factor Ts [Chloroflexi bacterium HGW-Chloroflexi-1]|nr:MAG: translation elongation factor Ts [Chloroflexi bacterium HGW-Chloroflexi-1]